MLHPTQKFTTDFHLQISMKHCCIVIVFCICFSIYKASSANFLHKTKEYHNQRDTLKLVHLIFRHGDRTPIDEYPKDPYNDLSYWPEGWGQLTKIGKKMHLELGRFFRTRYDGFLSRSYLPSEVYVRSSDADRTIMSTLANLAGLFPPTELDKKSLWDTDIKWQPIPVRALPPSVDNVIAFKQPCPQYTKLLNEFLTSDYMKEFDRKNSDLYEYLSEHTGLNVTSYNPVSDTYDTLKIQKLYNLTLPSWTKSVFPDKMYPSALLWVQKFTFTDELLKLRVGPFISELLGTQERSVNLTTNTNYTLPPNAKMYMYGAHDDVITSILKAFGVYQPHIPPYASTIFIELHKSSVDEPYVKIFYRTDLSSDRPDELTIKGCGNPCYLSQLKELLHEYLYYGLNWKQLCGL